MVTNGIRVRIAIRVCRQSSADSNGDARQHRKQTRIASSGTGVRRRRFLHN